MRGIRTIWFDLETNGLNPFHNRIIEIGAIDNDDNAFQSLIKIGTPLEQKIVDITKITDTMLDTMGVEEKIVIESFHTYLTNNRQNTRTFMIAHNGDSFDRMFIKTAFKKYGLTIPSNIFFVDSLHLARMTMPNRTSFKQEFLAERFKITNPSPHRAYGDVIVLRGIWEKMVELFSKLYPRSDIVYIYNTIYF
jgi:DNA polymerase III alpha subunit (gram-positive type)